MGILQIFDTGYGLKLVDPEISETGGSSGAITLDLTSSRNFDITATGAITWTFLNAPTGYRLTTTFKLVLENGGTGAQTWPASVTWLSGSAPSLKASGTNILQFTTTNAGTTWLGADITPASELAITSASLTSTGFTLDPSKTTEISFFINRANAITGNPRFQQSSNGGTTWNNLISFTGFPTDTGIAEANGGAHSPPSLRVSLNLYYYNSSWHFWSMWTTISGVGNNSFKPSSFYTGRSSVFTPVAATIYRFDLNQAGWVSSSPVVSAI